MTSLSAVISPQGAGWRLGMGTLLQGLNSSMIAVALTDISTDFNDSTAAPWLISALYFTAAVSSPTFGHLSDLYGAKKIYRIGLLITLIASVLGPLSPNIWSLVAARALIGIGTAAQMPTAITIVVAAARMQQSSSSTAVGIISMLGQVSAAIGPALGGFIVTTLGWQWIFWINIPLICNAYLWTRSVPETQSKRNAEEQGFPSAKQEKTQGLSKRLTEMKIIDAPGITLFCFSLIALLYGLLGTTTPRIMCSLILAGAGFLWFYRYEMYATHPFMDFFFLRSHPVVLYIYLRTIIVNVAFYLVFYGIPQWAGQSGGMDAMQSGFMLLPNFIAGVITTRFAASKAGSWHPRTMRTVGCSLLVLSAALSALAFMTKQTPLLYAATFLLGLPSGFNNMGNQLELNRRVRPEDLGQATGIFRTSQFIGAAISTPIAFHTLHSATVPISPILLLMIAIIGIGLLTFIVDSIYRFRMHPVD